MDGIADIAHLETLVKGRVVGGSSDNIKIKGTCAVDNSVVCRATFEDCATTISDDVKIADLVAIGHNTTIGRRTTVAGLTCISGSSKIGEDAWIGACVTVTNNITVGNRAKILPNSVVAYDVAKGDVVNGFYAMPHRDWKRAQKNLKEFGKEMSESRQ